MKKFCLLALLFCCFLKFRAQQKSFSWENVSYGGAITLGIGSQATIGLAPNALYNFENGLCAGLGVGYLYSSFGDFTTSAFSFSIISLYQTPYKFQLSAEFDKYFANQKDSFRNYYSNFPALHLGVAYKFGKFAIGIRFDVLYDENRSIFASPISPVTRFYF